MNHIIIALTLLVSFIGADYALAQDNTNCISQKDLTEISTHFKQFSKYANKDFCSDGSQDFQMLASLQYMRKTQFAAQMPKSTDDFFSGKFANDWYKYFIGRIKTISVETSCPKGAIAYVMGGFMGFSDKTMHVCPMALTPTFSTLDLSSVFMHEARHIDGYPHITCSHGPRKGLQGACDVKISDGGSYAVTVETYAQLAKYAVGLHPALRAYARSSAAVYGQEAFEVALNLDKKNNLVIMTEDLNLHKIDTDTLQSTIIGQAPAAGQIIKRSFHSILVPTDKSLKAGFLFLENQGTVEQVPGDIITEYNQQSPAEKAKLVDFHIGAQWTARVYSDVVKFTCDPRSDAKSEVALPAGEVPTHFLYDEGYARDVYKALLSTESGALYEVGCKNKQAYLVLSKAQFDQKYKRIYKINDKVFGLTNDGALYVIDGQKSTPVIFNSTSKAIEITPYQTYTFM